MKKITLVLIILFCQFSLTAQVNYKQKAIAQGANYFDIVKNTRTHFKKLKSKSSFTLSGKKQEKQFCLAFFMNSKIDLKPTFLICLIHVNKFFICFSQVNYAFN
jgi:hypothetical protein